MAAGPKPLSAKHRRFCREYLVDLNAKQAAIRAGYSPRTAYNSGYTLMQRPDVQKLIQEMMAARAERTEITMDRVLQEWAKIAFLDPRQFFDADGNLIDIHALPADAAAALAGMDVSTERIGEDADGKPRFGSVRKIRFADKKGALDSVARHLGGFNDKVSLGGEIVIKWAE
jgi:phage terminase small subunit